MSRIEWDEFFLKTAYLVAERSTCLRRMVGAVLVKDKRIIATGYNGAPSGHKHCLDVGCMRKELKIPRGERYEICRAIHAEQNCIVQCAKHGIPTQGSILYCTLKPCMMCAREICNTGIKEIIVCGNYSDDTSDKYLEESGVSLRFINPFNLDKALSWETKIIEKNDIEY